MASNAGGDRDCTPPELAMPWVCGRGRRGGRGSRLVHRWVSHTQREKEGERWRERESGRERECWPTGLPFYVHLQLVINLIRGLVEAEQRLSKG